MIFTKLKSVIQKLKTFHEINGLAFTLLEIQFRVKSLIDRQYSYHSLLKQFPRKFDLVHGPKRTKKQLAEIIDARALDFIKSLLEQLGISVDASRVAFALKYQLSGDRYYRVLRECFLYEQFVETSSKAHVYPLLYASTLPEVAIPPRRRNILFITSVFPSPHHGGGNRVLNFIKSLGEGNDVYLVTSYFPQDDMGFVNAVTPYCRGVLKIPRQRFGENQAEILKWLNGKEMDIVHYEWPRSLENFERAYGPYQIFTYMEAVSLRLIMDIKQNIPLTVEWIEKFYELIYALRLEIAAAAVVDVRIAVTHKDGDFFRDIYPHQEYVVLNHGVSFDEFCLPEIESVRHSLVFVGNYEHYPNVDALTYFFSDIWPAIQKEVPDVCIYVVGARPPREILALADGERIIVTGSVPDVRPYIQKASVCIAPLLTGAGLRGKVIEYAALRRPFVATSIATTDLVFKDGIDYFCADTASDFSQKVIALLKDEKLAMQMGVTAFETAQRNYDTHRLVNFLYRLYQHLEGG
jgi:glycosyltransferase involved in cell wall biosynthesis